MLVKIYAGTVLLATVAHAMDTTELAFSSGSQKPSDSANSPRSADAASEKQRDLRDNRVATAAKAKREKHQADVQARREKHEADAEAKQAKDKHISELTTRLEKFVQKKYLSVVGKQLLFKRQRDKAWKKQWCYSYARKQVPITYGTVQDYSRKFPTIGSAVLLRPNQRHLYLSCVRSIDFFFESDKLGENGLIFHMDKRYACVHPWYVLPMTANAWSFLRDYFGIQDELNKARGDATQLKLQLQEAMTAHKALPKTNKLKEFETRFRDKHDFAY